MAELNQRVKINGEEYELKGNVDFSNLTINKIGTGPVPDPDPEVPPVDPTNPNVPTEGTIKPGGWGADTSNKDAWKVVNMKNPADQFKIVDGAGKNVATNFKSKEVATNFIAYFQKNPFPPVVTPPPVDPNQPPVEGGGSGTDKYGTKLLVSNGAEIVYDVKDNFREDGKRFDLHVGEWPQSEAQGYFRFTKDPVDDEVSIKWSEMPHSGSNKVNCYDSGVSIKNGKTRVRMEVVHPNYSGALGTGQGFPLPAGKWIGYKGTKTVSGDSVTIKLYQDTGDNETKPSNEWKEVFSHTDTQYKRTGPHPYVTLRIDDPAKKGQKNLEGRWISVAKI